MPATFLVGVLGIMATGRGVCAPPRGKRLLFKRVKIDTANIEQGMYIAQLDRPWLETPFLFQGFLIREESEIQLLRKFCKHVYADVDRSTVPREKILEAHKTDSSRDPFMPAKGHPAADRRPVSFKRRILSSIGRLDPTGSLEARLNRQKHYRNVVSTQKEAPRAAAAYEVAVTKMNEVFATVMEGGGVKVDNLKAAVTPMIDSVLRNQDAMAWLVYLRKRDEYAYNHSIASSVWAVVLGRHLGFDRMGLNTLAMGGMLLDVGKAKVPQSITLKEGPLDERDKHDMASGATLNAFGKRMATRKEPG